MLSESLQSSSSTGAGGMQETLFWLKLRAKSFFSNTFTCYLDFVKPLSIFFIFNMVADMHTRDPEKYGLMWLAYADTDEDAQRNKKFPDVSAGGARRGKGGAGGASSGGADASLDALLEEE